VVKLKPGRDTCGIVSTIGKDDRFRSFRLGAKNVDKTIRNELTGHCGARRMRANRRANNSAEERPKIAVCVNPSAPGATVRQGRGLGARVTRNTANNQHRPAPADR